MNSKEKLKKILYEWSEFILPDIYPRDFNWKLLEGNEILSIIGARRAGKTYLCYQIIKELQKKLSPQNIIYLNLEDERLHPLKGDELTLVLDLAREVYSIDSSKKIYLFVDEIQNAKNWSKWARRITDQNRNIKLIITGSSSRLLSKEISTELRGRTLSFKVYPLSFSEYLVSKGVSCDVKSILYTKERPIIKKYFNEYVSCGGFPAVINSFNRAELLKEYYGVMFYRDIVERHRVENIRLLEDYLALLIDQTSCMFSVSMTAKKLSEFGYSFSKSTVSNFSKYAMDAFMIFEVNKYSYKIREQMRAPKKIYVIDHGLAQAVRFAFQDNYGRMLENIAFMDLVRKGEEVYYYKEGRECDFLTVSKGKISGALQVTMKMSDAKTREREISGLTEAMKTHNIKNGFILTDDDSDEIKTEVGVIKVLPLWFWLLRKVS